MALEAQYGLGMFKTLGGVAENVQVPSLVWLHEFVYQFYFGVADRLVSAERRAFGRVEETASRRPRVEPFGKELMAHLLRLERSGSVAAQLGLSVLAAAEAHDGRQDPIVSLFLRFLRGGYGDAVFEAVIAVLAGIGHSPFGVYFGGRVSRRQAAAAAAAAAAEAGKGEEEKGEGSGEKSQSRLLDVGIHLSTAQQVVRSAFRNCGIGVVSSVLTRIAQRSYPVTEEGVSELGLPDAETLMHHQVSVPVFLAEVAEGYSRMLMGRKASVVEMFNTMDTDEDGLLNAVQFDTMVRQFEPGMSEEDLGSLYVQASLGSGSMGGIDEDGLLSALAHHPMVRPPVSLPVDLSYSLDVDPTEVDKVDQVFERDGPGLVRAVSSVLDTLLPSGYDGMIRNALNAQRSEVRRLLHDDVMDVRVCMMAFMDLVLAVYRTLFQRVLWEGGTFSARFGSEVGILLEWVESRLNDIVPV